jgi:hypothetical protein
MPPKAKKEAKKEAPKKAPKKAPKTAPKKASKKVAKKVAKKSNRTYNDGFIGYSQQGREIGFKHNAFDNHNAYTIYQNSKEIYKSMNTTNGWEWKRIATAL